MSLGGRALLRVVVAGLVAVSAGLVLEVLGATPAGALTCGPATSTRAAVAVVVDFGDTSPEGNCVALPMNSSGATTGTGVDALRAAGHTLRIEAGFLCAIDGVPATGCATGSGFDGWYWRYFKAAPGRQWIYTSSAVGYRIALTNGCAAEGWVWSQSPDVSGVRGGVPTLDCRPRSTSPTTPRNTTPPGTAPKPPANAVGGSSGATAPPTKPGGSSGAGSPSSTGVASPGVSAPGLTTPSGQPGSAPDSEGPAGTSASPDTSGSGEAADLGVTREDSTQGSGHTRDKSRSGAGPADAAERAAGHRSTAVSGGGSAKGVVTAGILLAGVALVAVWKLRDRRATRPGN